MTGQQHLRPVLALFWTGNRRMLAAGALLALTTALAGIALLGLAGWFLAATAIAGATLASALAFDVFLPSAGIRLLALGRTAARYGERLTTHDATLRVLARLRERLFRGWAGPEAARSLAAHPSRLLFRLTLDIDALDSLYLRVLVPVLAAAGSSLAVAGALAFLDPLLGLAAALVLLAAGLGLPLAAAHRAARSSRRRAHALEALRARTIDLVRGQADLALANRLGAQLRALAKADSALAASDHALNRIETDIGFRTGIAGAALLAGVLLAVAHLAEAGTIGAPSATLAVLLALAGLEPFAPLRRGAVEFGRTLLAAQRLGPLLGRQPRRTPPAHPATSAIAAQLASVSVCHPGVTAPALAAISLALEAGERVAVTGPSGAGKSTLLALLAGELAPCTGKIAMRPATLLTQRSQLFRDSLGGNLALARPDADAAQMLDALEAAGLSGFTATLPHGLATPLGEGGAGLSAGQARRLALARLLLRAEPVWLLDEPTEGLDGATARDVLARIGARAGKRTLVIATHNRSAAALAGRILVLRDGRLQGDHRKGDREYARALAGLRPG